MSEESWNSRPRQTWSFSFQQIAGIWSTFGSTEVTWMMIQTTCTPRDIIDKGLNKWASQSSLRHSSSSCPWETAVFNSAGRFGWSPYWRFVDVAAAFLCGRYGTSAAWCHQTYPNNFSCYWWGREVCEWNAWNCVSYYQFTESVYT